MDVEPGNETKTDKDGHFHLKKLDRHSRIELRISKDGFDPWYNPQQETAVADLNVVLNNRTYFEAPSLRRTTSRSLGR